MWNARFAVFLLTGAGILASGAPTFAAESATEGCTFTAAPQEWTGTQARARNQLFDRVRTFDASRRAAKGDTRLAAASSLPRRSFVDDEIFGKLEAANIPVAERTTDEEFVRRIYLDLTGKLPTPQAFNEFVTSTVENKRDLLIDKLLASPEFSDKWAVWLGDLVQNTEQLSTSSRAPQVEGRNSLAIYLRDAVANAKPFDRIVTELITGKGNNYFVENGPANYMVLASTAMGPIQDTYDQMLSRVASQFMGMAHYDCLLCHNGRGHLTGISAWGEKGTRSDAQRMSAHFSRTRLNNGAPAGARQYADPLFNSTDVQELTAGTVSTTLCQNCYDLNTNSGNRPNRTAVGTERSLSPEYRDGSKPPADVTWREAFAKKVVADPMYSRNISNRLWKQFFGLGLVDPVDTLDPARLDPKNPPPDPWTLQASHPELLEKLREYFDNNDGDLRAFMRLLVESNAYQLSSDYNDEWKYEYLALYPRHYPRRLDAEEIVDAVTQVTGVVQNYTWPLVNGQTIAQGTAAKQSDPVQSAMKLPGPSVPGGQIGTFMLTFTRGNRNTDFRSQAGSIPQQLSMMNDTFVLNRVKVGNSAVVRAAATNADNGFVIEDLFLRFLARRPDAKEKATAVAYLARGGVRNTNVEDLAWAIINKLDFLFSY